MFHQGPTAKVSFLKIRQLNINSPVKTSKNIKIVLLLVLGAKNTCVPV
jgi:hypothetical protein